MSTPAGDDKETLGAIVSKFRLGDTPGIEEIYSKRGADPNYTPGYAKPMGEKNRSKVAEAPGLGASDGKSKEVWTGRKQDAIGC